MKSYACIDRFVGKFAVCEVELISVEESPLFSAFEKEVEMMDVLTEQIVAKVGVVKEADILVVEHDGCDVTAIYDKDDAEKQRRTDEQERINNILANKSKN